MKIAIIGSGISGLTAAYLLHPHHQVSVFEANDYIGGHTATKSVEVDGSVVDIDTGFIVYNERTYPNFIKLMNKLSVDTQLTEMGFSVTTRHQENADFEYCGSTINSLFADRRRVLDPGFLKMVWDIVRFGKQAKRDLVQKSIAPHISLNEYLASGGYGQSFLNYYIIPMASAIWSVSTDRVKEFNAFFFIRFFFNHGLLDLVDRPAWRVVKGGSKSYIEPLVRGFRDQIRLSCPVTRVKRSQKHVEVTSPRGTERYDQIIFACHSDQALHMLEQPSETERQLLSAIPYKENSVVMHTDDSLLPRRKRAWASWNYLLDGNQNTQPVLTYNMNILQGIKTSQPVCVTMNGDQHIAPEKILGRYQYSHPQFGADSVAAQKRVFEISGKQRSWYCGAYWRNGFHEDGVVSAIRVVKELGGDKLN
ncbi:MAG: FAD-dependent oxidoreductase [Acidiferrobacterales bacterium]|nr:FAD-dependent oxidoreductase [Acidiferrobacterales bacterium]